jgi:hypothetical protein
MAKTLSKSGIVTGYDVNAWHITQSVDAFTKVEAYDITVSGSFTVTGSVNVRGTVFGRTTQTSSFAVTSSYSLFAVNSISSSLAFYNSTNQYTLQFYSPTSKASELINARQYGIGAGEALISGPGIYGITLPVNSLLSKEVTVTSTCKSQGTLTAQLQLMSGDNNVEYTFTNPVEYKFPYSSFNENITSTVFLKGTRLWFLLSTENGTLPTEVSHNIILTFKPV